MPAALLDGTDERIVLPEWLSRTRETTLSMATMQSALDLDKPWRIGEEGFAALASTLESLAPRVIVEFGSGASSVRLALHFPTSLIHSIDHDPAYAAETRALQQAHGVENLTVHCQPLRWQLHAGGIYLSYAPTDLPRSIDAVIIDGPPYFVHLGREACFYKIVHKLRLGGMVVLDDCNRSMEQRAVENWLTSFPGSFERKDLAIGHGLCILVKRTDARWSINWRLLADNYRAAATRITAAISRRIGHR